MAEEIDLEARIMDDLEQEQDVEMEAEVDEIAEIPEVVTQEVVV